MQRFRFRGKNREEGQTGSDSTMGFTSIVPDDQLKEVFLRLPNARSLVLSAAVCKRWRSLILTSGFIEHHRLYRREEDFSILFKFSRFKRKPYYQLSSDGCRPLDLSFVSNSPRLVIRASSGDLLLLSKGKCQFFICNPLTKLWFPLPEVPPLSSYGPSSPSSGFALVRRRSDAQELGRYRVVVIFDTYFIGKRLTVRFFAFDSSEGMWRWLSVFLPYPCRSVSDTPLLNLDLLNPGDGVLYWIDGMYRNYAGLFALCAFSLKFRMIPLPPGEFRGLRYNRGKEKVRGGVVEGRVRLSKTTMELGRFGLKVWELDSRSDTWSLVHDVNVVPKVPTELCFVVGFHPNDRDSVLVASVGQEIFRYQIAEDKYTKICKFPRCGTSSAGELKKRVGRYLKVLTLVNPFWPTTLPAQT